MHALAIALACQPPPHAEEGSRLRQGRVFTEEQARDRLAEMATAIPDAAMWRRRSRLIRENVLQALRLNN